MRKFLALSALLLSSAMAASAAGNCDGSGNCYVRAGATGSGNGSNWTNACPGLTGMCAFSSLQRGTTYWVAGGSYSSFGGTLPSGTTLITIQAATLANHGPATDWNAAFAGQAVFTGCFTISGGFLTVNGQSRNPDWKSGYNIKFVHSGSCNGTLQLGSGSSLVNNITVSYIQIEGSGSTSTNEVNLWIQGGGTNINLNHSFLDNPGNANVQDNEMSAGKSNTETFEYNWICCNHGTSSSHSESFATTASNLIIRYNVFQNIMSTGIIASAAGPFVSCSNWEFYGNLVFYTDTFANDPGTFLGDGIVNNLSCTPFSGHVYFYNNTIANLRNPNSSGAMSSTALGGSAGWSSGTPTLVVENNLWWNSVNPTDSGSGNITLDYNSYYGGTTNSNDTSAHKQTSSSNPFVNSSANTIAGFALSSHTSGGATLPSPYNSDMLGVIRGSNGTWDRGTLQLGSGTAQLPNSPVGLQVTSVQ